MITNNIWVDLTVKLSLSGKRGANVVLWLLISLFVWKGRFFMAAFYAPRGGHPVSEPVIYLLKR